MSISPDGWFTWMIRDPAPLWKTNPGINGLKIVVPHSAEGYWPYLRDGEGMLMSAARKSWFASNLKDGRCFQHYSIYARTWTSSAQWPNDNGLAWENEGTKDEPLTDKQDDNNIRIIREVSALKSWKLTRPTSSIDKTATGYEHNECQRWGAPYTACPSGRILWTKYMAALEDEMAERVWDGSRTWIVGKGGASLIEYPAMDKPLEAIYGPHTKVMTVAQLEALRV